VSTWAEKNRYKTWKWKNENPEAYRAKIQRRVQKIKDYLNKYKVSAGCIDCGYNANPVALAFDHIRGEKTKRVSMMRTWRAARKEVEKCVVRCHNCHAIRHSLLVRSKFKVEEKKNGIAEG